MTLTRRGLFKSIAGILATAYTVGKITYGVKPVSYPHSLSYYLTCKWSAYFREHKKMPTHIRVSQQFFDAWSKELTPCQRFTDKKTYTLDEPSLKFKSGTVTADPLLRHSEVVINGQLYL